MHQDEATKRLDHCPHVLARRVIGRNRRADSNTAIFRNFGGNIANTANIDVAVFFRKTKLRREVFAHEIAVEQCHRPAAHFEELNHKHVRDRRFTSAGKTRKKHGHPLFVPRWEGAPQFLRDFRKGKPGRNLAAVV